MHGNSLADLPHDLERDDAHDQGQRDIASARGDQGGAGAGNESCQASGENGGRDERDEDGAEGAG